MSVPSAKLEHTAASISGLSLLPHILCCLLPTLAALVSILSTLGLAGVSGAALARHLHNNPVFMAIDAWHPWLLGLAIATVAFSGALNLLAWRSEQRKKAATTTAHHACHHSACNPAASRTYHRSRRLFFLSLGLLAFDLLWFALESHFLHTH